METVISSKITIKSSIDSPRLAYTLDFIFNHFFDCGFDLNPDSHQNLPCISYNNSSSDINNLSIPASSYLSSTDILPDPEAINPDSPAFDIFAFVFYFLSRAEEYDFQSDDSFHRFTSAKSHFGDQISKPLVDIQVLKFAEAIREKLNINLTRRSTFTCIHTVDIDQFYAFKNKSLKRTIGGLVSSTLKANVNNLKDRKNSLTKGDDPYDSFDFLQSQSKDFTSFYFILVGNYDKIDNALDITQNEIKDQLHLLDTQATIGLHPSVSSRNADSVLTKEKQTLESVMNKKILHSRQHFLQLNFPETYRQLIKQGIQHDHSLGYHDAIGFRAGTSNPFYWFDLNKNQATELMIHPLLAMDVTLKKYLQLQPDQAITQVKKLINQCKEVDAPFSLLWHNSSFYEAEGWGGWKEVYLEIVNYCRELSA